MDVKLLLTMGAGLNFLHHGIYQLNFVLLLLFREGYRQLLTNRRIFAISRRIFNIKKVLAKRNSRRCWVKSGRTDAWWRMFEENIVTVGMA